MTLGWKAKLNLAKTSMMEKYGKAKKDGKVPDEVNTDKFDQKNG